MTKPQAQDKFGQRWLLLGYLLTAALLLFRLGYIASGTIELSNDEAYQWLWSKHLALSYFSKPPGIAFIQFAGTALWGDTQFGVRFFSPVFAAILSVVVLRFMAREVGARQGLLLLLILTSAPLMGLGTILMTVDPPLVLCCTLAMIAGWRAAQPDGTTKQWLFAGLAAGLGFLCKYSAVYLIVCWALFFLLWPPARAHLKKSGPYLALLIFALCMLPVIIWNSQNGWITVRHVADNAGMTSAWRPQLRYFGEFLALEALVLNPVFFIAMLWAMVAFWKCRQENPLGLYFWFLAVFSGTAG
jgi:4-amino-4-deoxy-L-arabinose transferase-like glycosyltransferase